MKVKKSQEDGLNFEQTALCVCSGFCSRRPASGTTCSSLSSIPFLLAVPSLGPHEMAPQIAGAEGPHGITAGGRRSSSAFFFPSPGFSLRRATGVKRRQRKRVRATKQKKRWFLCGWEWQAKAREETREGRGGEAGRLQS